MSRTQTAPREPLPGQVQRQGLERFQFSVEGLHLDKHVDFLGPWSIETGKTKGDRYMQLEPEILVVIVETRPAVEVLRERAPCVAEQIHRGLDGIEDGRRLGKNGGPK